MEGVERLWEEYRDFENGLSEPSVRVQPISFGHSTNRNQAKKLLSDLEPAYMHAHVVLGTLQKHLRALSPPTSPSEVRSCISLPRPPKFDESDKTLVGRWRIYLRWEEGNPLQLEAKDGSQLHLRLQNVHRKAVAYMRFYPEIWLVLSHRSDFTMV